jgi:hypothetical protein
MIATQFCRSRAVVRALACTFALAVSAITAVAQTGVKPVVILFVGNSFFHGAFQPVRGYNVANVIDENASIPSGSPRSEAGQGPYGGIPGIFKKLTDEVGLNYEVHSELVSGRSLEFHHDNALDVINQAKWDVVIMHDFSTGPVPKARTGNPERFTKFADLLEQTVHSANRNALVYLYATWPRADLTYPEKGPYHGDSLVVFARDLHDGYYGEFVRNGHFKAVAPAGDAWMRAIHDGVAIVDPAHPEAGKVNLWGIDSYHPSIYGAYLNALVVLYTITGKDPRALGKNEKAAAELGIAPDIAAALERVAYEQVRAAR